jgi:hypothetical protein
MGLNRLFRPACAALIITGLAACASLNPTRPEVNLPESKPHAKVTSYTQALGDLGLMTEIYGTPVFKIQCNPIGDNTGSSGATGAEIPRDITEMMKSSLNAIGGKVTYIPYDPSFIQNQVVTGYSNFHNKTIPDAVLTGGITEFDRGLETRSSGTDISAGYEFNGVPDSLGMATKAAELRNSQGNKSGLARITLDFNMLDFQTMTGISKSNVTNSMEVHKALSERELGVSIFGQSFGGKGSVKKVQGRHAAVRLLVELSMIQIVGKHLRLPYWRLLGEDAKADQLVIDEVSQYYRYLTDAETISNVQEWLYLYGYNTQATGRMDEATKKSLEDLLNVSEFNSNRVDFKTFYTVYANIPITPEAKRRRESMSAN